MVAHNEDFNRGIAMVLRGESLKAGSYVSHNLSLGVLREKMVSRFVRDETPTRFSVETGLIRNHQAGITSRQCDLLIHEPSIHAPLYRWEDFVVVQDLAARAVVEVKSNLDEKQFEHLLKIHISVISLEMRRPGGVFIPTFGYGLRGAAFDTFVAYLKDALTKNRLSAGDNQRHLNLPFCIAVQSRNYLGLRPLSGAVDKPICFCAVDFSQIQAVKKRSMDGYETGAFLQMYSKALEDKRLALPDLELYQWFNSLPLKTEGKVWLKPDGTVTKGNIPL